MFTTHNSWEPNPTPLNSVQRVQECQTLELHLGAVLGSKAGLQQHQIPDWDLQYLDQRAAFLWISQSLRQRSSLQILT